MSYIRNAYKSFKENNKKNPSKTISTFMELAKQEALKSTMNYKHGAVIYKGQEIISTGYNYDYGQEILHGKYSVHAEVCAIMNALKAKKNLEGTTMVVIRIAWKRNNRYVNSKPCENCANCIIKHKIGTVFYS